MALPTDANVDFLVCDAVRQNAEGKLDIAGFFPNREVKLAATAPLPVSLNLTFIFVLKDGDGKFATTLSITDPLGKELHRYELPQINKLAAAAHALLLPVAQIPIAHSGNYTIAVEIGGQSYQRTVRIFQ